MFCFFPTVVRIPKCYQTGFNVLYIYFLHHFSVIFLKKLYFSRYKGLFKAATHLAHLTNLLCVCFAAKAKHNTFAACLGDAVNY